MRFLVPLRVASELLEHTPTKVWVTAPSTLLDQPYHPCLTFQIVTHLELTPL